MENNEFLIDHRSTENSARPMAEEDFADHSLTATGANNNLLLGGAEEKVATTTADGTFLVDDDDDEEKVVQQHQQPILPQSPPSSAMMFDDDGISKPLAAESEPAAVSGRSSQQHSSSIDDFEFIATPQSTTDREVKMDNLLDFDAHPAPATTGNLVETLLTGEDLKPHKDAAAAYLENEFAQFKSGSQQPQEFNLAKPIKDVYSDFMEAERGARVDLLHREPSPEPEQRKEPVKLIENTPIVPLVTAIKTTEESIQAAQPEHVNFDSADDDDVEQDDDDLLEQQFTKRAEEKKPVVIEAEKHEKEEEKKPIVVNEPKAPVPVATAAPAVSVVSKEETAKPQQQPAAPEEIKTKPKEVEAPKPSAPIVPPPAPVAAQKKPKDELITTSAEEMFCKFGLDAWFKPERLHPKVESLIYWRDVKKSGIVCGAGMVILLAMSCFSVISVFAYSSLLALVGTVAFRIYKSVMQAIQKTSEGHPFKAFMDFELQLPQEKVQQVTGVAVTHINSVLAELRRLFLVEDLVDSIKFGLMLWCLTYVGAWFNGMTLVILSYVALFTLPKVYETNKQSIDAYLDLVRSKINEITEKVKAAIPIGKKVESDKEK